MPTFGFPELAILFFGLMAMFFLFYGIILGCSFIIRVIGRTRHE